MVSYFVLAFKDIYVSFLVVGHTHEDVDQRHSVFWRFFNQQRVLWTLPQMIEAFAARYRGRGTTLSIFPGCWDFKSWLEPNIAHVEGITDPHCFHLYKGMCYLPRNFDAGSYFITHTDNHGAPRMLWKQWGTSGAWSGDWEHGHGICLFETYPSGFPHPLPPAPLHPDIISDLPKLAEFAAKHATPYGEYFISFQNGDIPLPPFPENPARVFALHYAIRPPPPLNHRAHCTNPMRLQHRQLQLTGKFHLPRKISTLTFSQTL